MDEPKSISDFLLVVKQTSTSNFILCSRHDDPRKNPLILMRAMGYTIADVKEKVLDRLTPQECYKMCQENRSEGKTSLVWIFEHYHTILYLDGSTEEFHIYIKLTIDPASHITAISFHSWDIGKEQGEK